MNREVAVPTDNSSRYICVGDKWKGRTRRHPYIVVVLQLMSRSVRVEVDGGQHDGKRKLKLPIDVLTLFYERIKPTKKARKDACINI